MLIRGIDLTLIEDTEDDVAKSDAIEDEEKEVEPVKLTPEQSNALAEYLMHQNTTFTSLAAGIQGEVDSLAEERFDRLVEVEREMAVHSRGERISLSEAMDRASRKFPEVYESYRRSVAQ